MRDVKRINRITAKLMAIWYKYPDMRFYQLLEYLDNRCLDKDQYFYLEDDEFEKVLDKELEK